MLHRVWSGIAAYGAVLTAIDPADGTHEAYSPGYRPDLVALCTMRPTASATCLLM